METGLVIKELAERKIDLEAAIQQLEIIFLNTKIEDFEMFRAEVLSSLAGLTWALEQDPWKNP